ncbi:MAG TPA: hypothetical protein VML94_03865 [Thermoplasmata archaeon]|nr:hypothetical protein [Thermoplasmata archaeon]
MLLHAGESTLRSAYAVLESAHGNPPHRGPGVLYLTNRRIVFESPVSRGVVRDLIGGRDSRLVLDVPLTEVRNVSVRRGRIRGTRLVVELLHDRPAFDVLDPEAWVAAVAQARRDLPPPAAPGAPSVHLIERQVVKIRCRYCGTLGNEGEPRCPFCGASL